MTSRTPAHLSLFIALLCTLGASTAALAKAADCCRPGASCCHPGSPCCAGHKH